MDHIPPYQTRNQIFRFLQEHQYALGKDLSPKTLGMYAKDVEQFLACIHGDAYVKRFKPPSLQRFYIKKMEEKYAFATIERKVISLRLYYACMGGENPFSHDKVSAYLSAVKRRKPIQQKQAKAFDRIDLIRTLGSKKWYSMKDIRDRAMVLTGYIGALRISELLALNVGDVEFCEGGILLHIGQSKTNQYGEPDVRSIPASVDDRLCAVKALQSLLNIIPNAPNLPLFYSMHSKHCRTNERLQVRGFNYLIKKLLGSDFSSHSMRVSFVTNGRKLGASDSEIMQQTKHTSPEMIRRYTQIHDVREHNAVNRLVL